MKTQSPEIIFLTGATDGIGKLTAFQLAGQKAHLLLHGRNKSKTTNLVDELKQKTGNEHIEGFVADLSALEEVRQLAKNILEKHDQLNVLINNAGAGFADPQYSKDGYELRFAVNYLAPFLLTHLLLPALKNGAPSRIVNVSSAGQKAVNFDNLMFEENFDAVDAYRQSKLALIMFTFDLAEELKEEEITVNSLHPGTYLNTKMVTNAGIRPWGKPEKGAEAEVYLATSPELSGVTGKYFDGKKEARANAQAYDAAVRKRLKEITLKLVDLENHI